MEGRGPSNEDGGGEEEDCSVDGGRKGPRCGGGGQGGEGGEEIGCVGGGMGGLGDGAAVDGEVRQLGEVAVALDLRRR